MTDINIMQYIMIGIYFLFFKSNRKPAVSPLAARRRRGHCPISVPAACSSVTALSSVLKIHAISATNRARKIPVVSLPVTRAGETTIFSRSFSCEATGFLRARSALINSKARILKKAESTIASANSALIRLLLIN